MKYVVKFEDGIDDRLNFACKYMSSANFKRSMETSPSSISAAKFCSSACEFSVRTTLSMTQVRLAQSATRVTYTNALSVPPSHLGRTR